MNKNNRFNTNIINKLDKIKTKYENKKEDISRKITKIDDMYENMCESAKYGNEFIYIDVTKIINDLIKNKKTDFVIDDLLFLEKSRKIKMIKNKNLNLLLKNKLKIIQFIFGRLDYYSYLCFTNQLNIKQWKTENLK